MIRVGAPELDPAEALRRVSRGERPFLLDGGVDVDGLGRYTFAGCDPDDGFSWRRGDAGDPLRLLEAAQRRWSVGPIDSAPWPIAVGFIGYDLGAEIIARPRGHRGFRSVDDLGLPAVDLARYRAVWRRDARTGRCELLAHDLPSGEQLLRRLAVAAPALPLPSLGTPRWETGDADYRARVERVLDYLHAGDAYQVNLSHRLLAPVGLEAALPLYLRLRAVAPAPLGAFLELGGAAILANTPERFLKIAGSAVETRPIKGTRPRREGDDDARGAAELAASEKDRAEHVMIVDLERSDLGRVAQGGSVVAEGPRSVVLPTVHHLVSTVSARLRSGVGLGELLAATFPGGSVTGAPKLRAMEIIDELEPVMRGPYCGALGWLGPSGHADLALAIRTAVVRGGELVLSVGGGIVADSSPEGELAETRVKAAAFLRALI